MESEPPYLYVRGNPVRWIDPSGMYLCEGAYDCEDDPPPPPPFNIPIDELVKLCVNTYPAPQVCYDYGLIPPDYQPGPVMGRAPSSQSLLPPVSECSNNDWVLVTHYETPGYLRPYFNYAYGFTAAKGVISAGRQNEHKFWVDVISGETGQTEQSNFEGSLSVVGGKYSVDYDTGETSTSGFLGVSLLGTATGALESGFDGSGSVGASGGLPFGLFALGLGIDAKNATNRDLTAVKYLDAQNNGGLQNWVLRLTGNPMHTVLGYGETFDELYWLARDTGRECRNILGFEYIGDRLYSNSQYVTSPRCMY